MKKNEIILEFEEQKGLWKLRERKPLGDGTGRQIGKEEKETIQQKWWSIT